VPAAATKELDEKLDAVTKALEARNATLAAKEFIGARHAYLEALVDDFVSALALTRPAGFTEEDWTAFKHDFEQKAEAVRAAGRTDVDRAIARLDTLSRAFLAGVLAKLEGELSTLELDVAAVTDTTKRTAAETAVKDARTAVTAAVQAVRGDLEAARKAYETAAEKFDAAAKLVDKPKKLGEQVEDTGVERAAAAPTPAKGGEKVVGREPAGRAALATRIVQLERTKLAGDIVLEVLSFLVTVGMGAIVLKVFDVSWAGPEAKLNAAFWGLGLHQVSGAAFDAASLRAKLSQMGL
jgi:hypothetical protein